ncbi:MAG: hypothetical protein IT245_04840 [Bacteroidia bacterium]|nr:hypothetical protein [Bacteroidia bacterium]
MMRSYFSILLLFLFSNQLLAQDTVYLAGDMRNYEDSFVFRWNTKRAIDFLALSHSNLVFEIKSQNNANWQNLTTFNAINPDAWANSKSEVDNPTILAAAAIKQMRLLMDNPIDDPATAIQREQDLNFLWMNLSLAADISPSAANKCHLRFSLKKSDATIGAMFRLYLKTDKYISDTFYFLPGDAIYKQISIDAPTITEKENEVELMWLPDKKFSGYYIERAEANGEFKQLNRAALVIPNQEQTQLFFKDSVENYREYLYRIYALDMFGDKTQYSITVKAMGRDKTPPSIPSGLKIRETLEGKLIITWDEINANEGSKGLALGLRHQEGMPYLPIENQLLPLNTRSYTISIDPLETDYYILLQVFDTAANSSSSEAFYQINDNTPPEAPKGLTALVDKKGVVTLKWNQNKEKDLQGYMIYTSSHLKSEFSGVVNVAQVDTFFLDTLSLKMLNKDVYYRVVAVDYRLNRSPNSETVKVLRPDTLPPVSPNFKSFLVKDTFIMLRLNTSSSDDVKQNYLCRIQNGSNKKSIIKLNSNDTIYRDFGLEENTEYSYYMYAEDFSGNISQKSEFLQLKTLKNYYKPAVKLFTVSYDTIAKKVDIIWQYDMSTVRKVLIYKGPTPSELSKMPDQVEKDSNSFSDTHLKKGEWYYAIKLYLKDGSETLISIPLGVIIN